MDVQNELIKKRIEWVDTARGIGILFVMFGHCYLNTIFTFWFYSFHIALFFFLSGYIFSINTKYIDFFTKKIKTLLVPYVFLALVTIFCNAILALTHSNSYDILIILKLYIVQCRYTPLWFIPCLFIAEQLMYLMCYIKQKMRSEQFFIIVSAICMFVFFLYKCFITIDLPWNADLSMLACSFICIGKYFQEKNVINKIKVNSCILSFMFIVIIILSAINNYYFGKVDWYSNHFANPIIFVLTAILGIFTIIYFSLNVNIPILKFLGRNSLIFFGLHRIVIDLTFVLYTKLGFIIESGNYISILFALFSVIISIIVLYPFNFIVVKYFPWCLGRKCRRS